MQTTNDPSPPPQPGRGGILQFAGLGTRVASSAAAPAAGRVFRPA